MIVVDANILISAVVGTTGEILKATIERDILLFSTQTQKAECYAILMGKLGQPVQRVDDFFEALGPNFRILNDAEFADWETEARARLHLRAQPDWPILAVALALDGAIWSHDRDFFGTGVAVWSTRNMRFAQAA